jgi:hypothetical protein
MFLRYVSFKKDLGCKKIASQFSEPVYISKPIRFDLNVYMTINMPALVLKRCLNVLTRGLSKISVNISFK